MDTKTRLALSTALLTVTLATTLALSGCDYASEGKISKDGVVKLAYTYEVGSTWSHELNRTDKVTSDEAAAAMGEPSDYTQVMKDRGTGTVKSVNSDGSATVDFVQKSIEDSIDGKPQELDEPMEVTVDLDTTGHVLSVKGFDDLVAQVNSAGEVDPIFDYLSACFDFTSIIYPKSGTAKIGEQWSETFTIDLPGMTEKLSVSTTARLVSVSEKDGKEFAVISHTSTLAPFSISVDMSKFFSAAGQAPDGTKSDFLTVKVSFSGEMAFANESTVDLATGQIITGKGTYTNSASFEMTEAPEYIVPSSQRGPFSMTDTGRYTLTRVEN